MTEPTPTPTPTPAPRGRVARELSDAPVIPIGLLVIGAYLAWFGVHYWRSDTKWPSDPIKNILRGTPAPEAAANTSDAAEAAVFAAYWSGGSSSSSGGTGSSGGGAAPGSTSAIAQDALKYVGAGYVFGGNASQVGHWDCSSFVSYVLGHDLGLPLPGGRWGDPGFPPHAHGPTTSNYLLWGTALNRNQVQAGDLVVWPTHMGIALSQTEIVAARTTASGTGTSQIDATSNSINESPHFRRVTGIVTV